MKRTIMNYKALAILTISPLVLMLAAILGGIHLSRLEVPQQQEPTPFPPFVSPARAPGEPVLPEAVELPTGPLVRLPSVDARETIPLPILAQPQRDRASLADPTIEASMAAALGEITPHRLLPVPFAPLNLPDPFE